MSYTSEIKKEIISRMKNGAGSFEEKRACLSAFVRTSGYLGVTDGAPTFFLVTETESVAEYFTQLFFELFGKELYITHATRDSKRGRAKLVLQCPPDFSATALTKLGISDGKDIIEGIDENLVSSDEETTAYIKGAFLGGGSCILPKGAGTGYHLEIVFDEVGVAQDFCGVLGEMELIAKLAYRKETFVAYIKSKEAISDFLAVVGAENALKKFENLIERRDESNRDNRAKNCMAGNADKTAIASVKQVLAIQKIKDERGFNDLSEELKTLAKTRLKYPEKSLRELAELLQISKSCLNHRLRKLMEIAEEI
jgi:DNA-binding protein WhiA